MENNSPPPSTSLQQVRRLGVNLPSLAFAVRVLFTGYLLATGIGMLMAGAQILATHGMADGEFGLSVDDVVYSYHGNRGSSQIEAKLSGTMKDKANTQEKATIVKWVRAGAQEKTFVSDVKPIFDARCIMCHSTIPGLPDFRTFEGVLTVAAVDTGPSLNALTRVSHIHLFGIAFIFFFSGLIFSLAIRVPPAIKAFVVAMPFVFLILDILSWWLTKFNPNFAYLTIFGGMGYMVSSLVMWLIPLYQMWLLPRDNGLYTSNEWMRSED